MEKKPCIDCLGHVLTRGLCHDSCKRYFRYRETTVKSVREGYKKTTGDIGALTRYNLKGYPFDHYGGNQ